MNIRVRRARPGDLDAIVSFNRAMAVETENKTLEEGVVRSGVRRALADPAKGRYYVAETGGQVVGQLMFTLEWSDWRDGWVWWIQSVYVDPSWRRRGVFSLLYRHLESAAEKDDDVRGLRLYVESDNTRAQQAYASLGMYPAGYQVMEMMFRKGGPGDA